MGERFNAVGRNCPICLRTGTLTGDRIDGAPLECTGCYARFIYRPNDPAGPTLERVRVDVAARNAGARIADDCFCQVCGRRGYRGTCPTCERAA